MNTLDQALNYPYAQYDGHFLYINGKSTPIRPPPGAPQAMLLNILDLHDLFHRRNITMEPPEHWVSLISFGSNRSPSRLAQKFPRNVPIISLTAQLKGFDVVRSAHFTSYGTLPATLISAPKTSVQVSLQWLPQAKIEAMHRSEAAGRNYLFSQVPAGHLKLEDGSTLSAWTYQSIHGPLYWNGGPQAFESIVAKDRNLPQCTQEKLLRNIHDSWNISQKFEDWLIDLSHDESLRQEATQRLKTTN